MITQPSLSDLLDGIAKTNEHVLMPALEGCSAVERVTEILMLLDRVQVEWPVVSRHLIEDNLDIELTLGRIEQMMGPGSVDAAGRAWLDASGPDGQRQLSAHELAERNRRLKGVLVSTMAALDLPATATAPAELGRADAEVRELLARMLHREREAHPTTPTRMSPLSRGGEVLGDEQARRMTSALEAFLAAEMPAAEDIHIADLRRMAGGASREAFVFDVSWREASGSKQERCVLLRQPVSSVLESDESATRITGSRRLPCAEFKMIELMEAQGIPVAHMLWVDSEGTWLERPFSIGRWIEGEADLGKLATAPQLAKILDDYVDILARVHGVDPVAAGVDFLGDPTRETAALEQVDLFANCFERQRLEEFPAISYMVRWLRKNAPVAGRVSVIHGDFRLGNFMWDESGIVAMLDWEQCHLGDPLEEIAFMYWPLWSLGGFVPIREFVRRYEEAAGITVDEAALAYYRVFIELKMSVVILTGIKSFYATPERQLMYGATPGFEMLRDCQLRVIDALAAGSPTVEFGDDTR